MTTAIADDASGGYLFTSESVTEGHPDKVADQISDAIVDAALTGDDENVRVACETLVNTNLIVISGELRVDDQIDFERIARETVREIGYDGFDPRFGAESATVQVEVDEQSPDIAQGVDAAAEHREGGSADEADLDGAGDQGMMFGYATVETPELMPLPIALAHRLARRLAAVRRDGTLPYLRPDGKTQVTVRYEEHRPVEVTGVLISTQHAEGADRDPRIRPDLIEHVIEPVIPADLYDRERLSSTVLVNPTGKFVVGGPVGDCGLTGRKIIVDTYGGMARHGGGAFSGKDPSKVDRSGAYAARHVAKNVVAAGLADRCEVQVAYAIGVARPVSMMVDTFGTGRLPDAELAEIVNREFDLRPGAFRRYLDLHRPIFRPTAAYGHFGREEGDFTWERTDRADSLRAAAIGAEASGENAAPEEALA